MARKNLFENWTHEEYAEEYEQLLIDNKKLRRKIKEMEDIVIECMGGEDDE